MKLERGCVYRIDMPPAMARDVLVVAPIDSPSTYSLVSLQGIIPIGGTTVLHKSEMPYCSKIADSLAQYYNGGYQN